MPNYAEAEHWQVFVLHWICFMSVLTSVFIYVHTIFIFETLQSLLWKTDWVIKVQNILELLVNIPYTIKFSSLNQKASNNKNDSYQNQLLIFDTVWHSHYGRNCQMLSKNYVIFYKFRGLMLCYSYNWQKLAEYMISRGMNLVA